MTPQEEFPKGSTWTWDGQLLRRVTHVTNALVYWYPLFEEDQTTRSQPIDEFRKEARQRIWFAALEYDHLTLPAR